MYNIKTIYEDFVDNFLKDVFPALYNRIKDVPEEYLAFDIIRSWEWYKARLIKEIEKMGEEKK